MNWPSCSNCFWISNILSYHIRGRWLKDTGDINPCRQEDSDFWFRYGCPEPDSDYGTSYYNDLATLFFSVPHQVLLLTVWTSSFSHQYHLPVHQPLCPHFANYKTVKDSFVSEDGNQRIFFSSLSIARALHTAKGLQKCILWFLSALTCSGWMQTIQQLLALGGGAHSPFSISSLAIYTGSFMLLFILAYGIATPGGIFMPSIMVLPHCSLIE